MTRPEFSNTFDTLLNSYNIQAKFGETASKQSIVLDEYEKSVLLTQAQDIIIKNYFEARSNPLGQGMDDSERRQVDFSSLITTAILDEVKDITTEARKFDTRGAVFILPKKADKKTTDVLFILNEKLIAYDKVVEGGGEEDLSREQEESEGQEKEEKLVKRKEFVIVPLSYKEYDREMSKPYAQPLKKQAWRLFENMATGFDLVSEIVPRYEVRSCVFQYRIRYIKRPQPIILEDLENLDIDGLSTASDCELNPILHMDILNKAVELAITTRGRTPVQFDNQNNKQ